MPLLDLRPQAVRRTPEQLVEHLKSFNLDLKFSAGIWFFSPSGQPVPREVRTGPRHRAAAGDRARAEGVRSGRARGALPERNQRGECRSCGATSAPTPASGW